MLRGPVWCFAGEILMVVMNLVLTSEFLKGGLQRRHNGLLGYLGFESRADHLGTLEKPSPVGSSHGYQRFM